MSSIDLISLGGTAPANPWSLGRSLSVPPRPQAVAKVVEQLRATSDSSAVLFWDASLGAPNSAVLQSRLASPVDCWHAGLRLGLGGLPGILDFISPSWMLSCDPPPDIEATSWRLSLRACLVKMVPLRKFGGPSAEFQTLAAAGLEMGHRWIRCGAFLRHSPTLVDDRSWRFEAGAPSSQLPFADELRFAYYSHGQKWLAWALLRALLTGYVSLPIALRAWRNVLSTPRPIHPAPLCPPPSIAPGFPSVSSPVVSGPVVSNPIVRSLLNPLVTVLIPTLDRYSYLQTLLEQLRQQTVPPLEIVIVDQTSPVRRQPGLYEAFRDLPFKVIYQTEPGQCTSRNAGLQASRGDFILFLDDDDEIPADLIANHLLTLAAFGAEISCGVANEVGAGRLPPDFRFLRTSDVFPTNNTLLRRTALFRSGLFDLAYDRRPRADGDLGLRLYLAGATLVLNPAISVLHHHAPAGGLRTHKARTVTYALSRSRVFCRALAGLSEFYLARRYFTRGQVRELYWHSVLGSFSLHGSLPKRAAKCLVGALLLPVTLWQLRSRLAQATNLAARFPQIPTLTRHPAANRRSTKATGESVRPAPSEICPEIL